MRHRVFGKHLGRSTGQRNALRRTLITQLFLHERIKTTKTKAQAIRGAAEHMITQVKNSLSHPDPMRRVHIRRLLNGRLDSNDVVEKLFTEIAPRYTQRPGGYTRTLKLGPRKGDNADMVFIELVDRPAKAAGASEGPLVQATGRARGFLNRFRRGGQAADGGATPAAGAPSAESKAE